MSYVLQCCTYYSVVYTTVLYVLQVVCTAGCMYCRLYVLQVVCNGLIVSFGDHLSSTKSHIFRPLDIVDPSIQPLKMKNKKPQFLMSTSWRRSCWPGCSGRKRLKSGPYIWKKRWPMWKRRTCKWAGLNEMSCQAFPSDISLTSVLDWLSLVEIWIRLASLGPRTWQYKQS